MQLFTVVEHLMTCPFVSGTRNGMLIPLTTFARLLTQTIFLPILHAFRSVYTIRWHYIFRQIVFSNEKKNTTILGLCYFEGGNMLLWTQQWLAICSKCHCTFQALVLSSILM